MSHSRNWFPFRRWLRSRLLELIDRWLPHAEPPRKYRALGRRTDHHRRRRRLLAALARKMRKCHLATDKTA
jgi:hypothetical protein